MNEPLIEMEPPPACLDETLLRLPGGVVVREAELRRQNADLLETVEALQVAQEDLMVMRLAVEAERARYQQLFEFATDGYLVTDLHGILREANIAGLTRLGLPYNHIKGKILANFIALDDRMRFRAFLNRLGESEGRLEWEGRLTPRHADAVDVVLTACRLRDAATNIYDLRWIVRDVTERRRLEQARQADQQRLLEQERRAGVLEERNRLAQEFHDTLAQGFTGISFLLGAAENALADDAELARAQIGRARQVAQESIVEARRSIRALRTQALECGGLSLALAQFMENLRATSGLDAEFIACGTPTPLPVQVEDDLLRIAQEAVTNALKHARPQHITVQLKFAPGQVHMRVQDDGRGFNASASRAPAGFGLIGMRERAARIGGKVVLQSAPDDGTKISVDVALPPPLNQTGSQKIASAYWCNGSSFVVPASSEYPHVKAATHSQTQGWKSRT